MMRHQSIQNTREGAPSSAAVWQATAAPGPALESLAAEIETDILVIGAGIAGLSTALHLAEAGLEVVVVEAEQPGSGATGQSGGLIAPDYIRHSPETIGKVLGRQAGEKLTRFLGGSAQYCFDLIERHGIECDQRQDGFWSPAHNEALAETQRAYAAQWSSRGFNVTFTAREDIRQALGSDRYCGGLHFADGGALNPLAYARGLAHAALKAGATIYAESPITSLSYGNGVWSAKTPGGTVKARRLVLAANGGNAALHPAMRRTVLPLRVVEFATAPLDPEQRAHVLPRGGCFTDKTPYVFSARYDGLGQLISAFPVSFMVRNQKAFQREAKRRLAGHFEALAAPQIDYLWEGTAWINMSFLPEIYDLGDNALAIQACNGRGISINTAIGRDMAAALAANSFEPLPILPRAPKPVRIHAAASIMPKVLMSLAYLSS